MAPNVEIKKVSLCSEGRKDEQDEHANCLR